MPVGAPKPVVESWCPRGKLATSREGTGTGTWLAASASGAAFVALPQIPPRNVSWFAEGKWVHLAKVAFEKFFMRKMKKGTTEHVFEKMFMNAVGIMKLKDK